MIVLTTLIQTLAASWKAKGADEAGAICLDERMMVIDLAAFVAVSAIIMWIFLR